MRLQVGDRVRAIQNILGYRLMRIIWSLLVNQRPNRRSRNATSENR